MDPVSNQQPPPVWVGHVILGATDVARSNDYFVKLGMRYITSADDFAVLELRGGTHLVLLPAKAPIAPGTPAPFDLMVEDIEATRKQFEEMKLAPSEMKRDRIHDSFTLTDPSGYRVTVNSTHVSDQPV